MQRLFQVFLYLFFSFLPRPQHVEVPRPGIKPAPLQQSKLQQWKYRSLNPLGHQRTPNIPFLSCKGHDGLWLPTHFVCVDLCCVNYKCIIWCITLCLKNLYNCALTNLKGQNSPQITLKDCLWAYNPQVELEIFHFFLRWTTD